MDRTKEPGSGGEPLFLDVAAAIGEAHAAGHRVSASTPSGMPLLVGGRYGLSSKEFTPAMVEGVFDELALPRAHGRGSPSASTMT